MNDNTRLDLERIRLRAEAATSGPWKLWGMTVMADRKGTGDVDDCDDIAFTADPDRGMRTFNADFIAHARADIPALLGALAAEQERADLAEALLSLIRQEADRITENEVDEDGDPLLEYEYIEGLHDARAGIKQVLAKHVEATP